MSKKERKSSGDLFDPIEESITKNEIQLADKASILALDVATITGFCTHTASGVWKLAPKKDESKGMRLIRFRSKLSEMIKLAPIKIIVFEAVVMYGKHPNFTAAEMVGVLKAFCEDNHIDYNSYMPTTIKKFATGKGDAKKTLMIQAAKEKYKIDILDDNHADAVHLYHLALSDLFPVDPF